MSVNIVNLGAAGGDNRQLSLASGQWAATIPIGTSWNTLRIGIRTTMSDTGANLAAGDFFFGVLSAPTAGLAGGPLNVGCTHFCGAYRINTSARTTAPVKYLQTMRVCKKVGAVITAGVPGTTATYGSADPTIRLAEVVEIIKGVPSFTINHLFVNGTNGLVDIADTDIIKDVLLDAGSMVNTGFNSYIGGSGTRYAVSGATVNVTESIDGYFDSICLAYGTSNTLYLHDVFYAIIA